MRAFRRLLSIYVFSYFPFGYEGRIWHLIVSAPDHCLYFYFGHFANSSATTLFTRKGVKNTECRVDLGSVEVQNDHGAN